MQFISLYNYKIISMSRELRGVDIDLPVSLDAIPLHKYMSYMEMAKKEQAKDDEVYFKTKTLQIFCDMTHDDVMSLDAVIIDSLVSHFVSLLDVPKDLPLVNRFFMDVEGESIEFGFIPKLDKMAFGAWIDADKYAGKDDMLHKLMAVLYRPISKKWKDTYNIRKYKGTDQFSEILKYMPTTAAISSLLFFYRLGKKLPKLTLDCTLEKTKEELRLMQRRNLEQNGGGIYHYTLSLRVRHLELMKRLGYPSIQP